MDDLFKTIIASGISGGLCGFIALWLQGWRFKSQFEAMEEKLEDIQREKFEALQKSLDAKASLEKVNELQKNIDDKSSRARVEALEKLTGDKIAALERQMENENREIRKSLTMIFDKITALCSKVDGAIERMKDIQTLNERLNTHIEKGDRHHG